MNGWSIGALVIAVLGLGALVLFAFAPLDRGDDNDPDEYGQ